MQTERPPGILLTVSIPQYESGQFPRRFSPEGPLDGSSCRLNPTVRIRAIPTKKAQSGFTYVNEKVSIPQYESGQFPRRPLYLLCLQVFAGLFFVTPFKGERFRC